MNKKQIIFTAVILIVFVFALTSGFVLIFNRVPKNNSAPAYRKPVFVTRDHTYHKKSFPAPYKMVGALPKQ